MTTNTTDRAEALAAAVAVLRAATAAHAAAWLAAQRAEAEDCIEAKRAAWNAEDAAGDAVLAARRAAAHLRSQ